MSSDSVLVIEDHPESLRLLSLLMCTGGHEVRTARDAEEALRILTRFTPRVILLDLGLPRMHGLDLLRLLRGTGALDKSTVFAISADWELENAARNAGCDEYFAKPIDAEELAGRVAQAIAQDSSSQRIVQ
jgi:CheY-like chemotaxis protein